MATDRTGETMRGDAARSSVRGAIPAALVVGLVAVSGYAASIVGTVVTACLAVSILACAPIVSGWSAGLQAVVAAVAVAGHVWLASIASASSLDLVAMSVGLGIGGACSVLVTMHLGERRNGETVRLLHQLDGVQQAVASLVTKARTPRPPEAAAPVETPDAAVERIMATVGSIGAALEQARHRQTTEISREREMGANFIGQAAHEFRTPLSVIQTAAEALRLFSGRMSSHLQQERLTTIEECVQEMSELLRNSLSFSRIDGAKVKCERQPVDVRKLAQAVVDDVQSRFGAREILLTVRGAARLPYLDPSLAREILTNLVTNAVKYSPDGGRVEVDAHVAAAEVRFRVVDHGIGIAPDDLPYVFDAFRRGQNVGEIAGTGLGLAITKRATELHGGTITAESQPGSGTTLTVTLQERVKTSAIEPTRAA